MANKILQQFAPILIIFALALTALIFDYKAASFDYNRTEILNGEWWRVITGHFFHTNTVHFILNTAGLILLASLHHKFYRVSTVFSLLVFSAVFISICLIFTSDLMRYVGLSGVLHAFFAWGALQDIKHKEKTGYLLFVGLWAKVIYEQLYGASAEVSAMINATVAVDAHLWGAIAGTLFFIFGSLVNFKTKAP